VCGIGIHKSLSVVPDDLSLKKVLNVALTYEVADKSTKDMQLVWIHQLTMSLARFLEGTSTAITVREIIALMIVVARIMFMIIVEREAIWSRHVVQNLDRNRKPMGPSG